VKSSPRLRMSDNPCLTAVPSVRRSSRVRNLKTADHIMFDDGLLFWGNLTPSIVLAVSFTECLPG
jgi:hypothetical protein